MKQLESENVELTEDRARQDSLLNEFLRSFNEIEENLAAVREKEDLIALQSGDNELRADQKDRIVQDIQAINELLGKNREKIAELEKKLSGSNWRLSEVRKTMARLKEEMAVKDSSIVTLKEALVSKDFAIGELNSRVDSFRVEYASQNARLVSQSEQLESQAELIEAQTKALNTAYIVVGSKNELMEKGVLDKKGIFGKPDLKNDLAEGAFEQIDITETFTIPVNAKKAKVLSSHPASSYVLNESDDEVATLEITDPAKFWETSRYLVIVQN